MEFARIIYIILDYEMMTCTPSILRVRPIYVCIDEASTVCIDVVAVAFAIVVALVAVAVATAKVLSISSACIANYRYAELNNRSFIFT